jgi:hypothetical protein
VRAERVPGLGDGVKVGVKVALRGRQGPVTGDLAQDVDGDTGVGHPGQAGVAEVVAAKMLTTEPGDDLVPMGRVMQDGGADPTARLCCVGKEYHGVGQSAEVTHEMGCGPRQSAADVQDALAGYFNQGFGSGTLCPKSPSQSDRREELRSASQMMFAVRGPRGGIPQLLISGTTSIFAIHGWLMRFRSSGWTFHQAFSRIRLTAMAETMCSRWTLLGVVGFTGIQITPTADAGDGLRPAIMQAVKAGSV